MRPDTFLRRWGNRFCCAGRGLAHVLRTEPSGRVHAVAAGGVILAGIWLGIGALEWAVLALAAGSVIAVEALNTAVERLADRVSGKQEESIRLVKDVAAGGVLAATLGAVAAGIAILGPPLWRALLSGGEGAG